MACCVGDYLNASKEELEKVFKRRYILRIENTLDVFLETSRMDPHLSCPYVGYMGEEDVGCLVHPRIVGSEIRPYLSRSICPEFGCAAADHFSQLAENQKRVLARRMECLDWYSKSRLLGGDFQNLFK